MSWAKVDDKLYSHPKFLGLNPAAVALWLYGLSYCGSQLTDGRIPRAQVPLLCAIFGAGPVKAFKLAALLVERHLWEQTEARDFLVHNYLDRNPSRKQVESSRAADAEKHRRARARLNEERHLESVTRPAGTHAGNPDYPVPTRPDPTQKERETAACLSSASQGGSEAGPADEVLADWKRLYAKRHRVEPTNDSQIRQAITKAFERCPEPGDVPALVAIFFEDSDNAKSRLYAEHNHAPAYFVTGLDDLRKRLAVRRANAESEKRRELFFR